MFFQKSIAYLSRILLLSLAYLFIVSLDYYKFGSWRDSLSSTKQCFPEKFIYPIHFYFSKNMQGKKVLLWHIMLSRLSHH